jgi:hypothetical protein
MFQRIPSIDVTLVGRRRGEVRSDNGMLGERDFAGRGRVL